MLGIPGAARAQVAPPLADPLPTLQQMVGALMLVGFDGAHADDAGVKAARTQAESGNVAGFVFYGYNIESPEQTRNLVAHMRTWDTPRPLILALDQEGGRVSRLAPSKGFAAFPSARDAVATGDAAVYEAMANLVADMGFDLNLAPVVDLAIHPDGAAIGALGRAFGDDISTVTTWASRFIQAHRDVGVRTALKHFPGHGSATDDSHRGFADVTSSWNAAELQPFYELVKANKADAIMSAHVSHRSWEPAHPVSLSRGFISRTLRYATGFDGPVISDALDMGALYHHYNLQHVVVAALLAGHDLLLFSHNSASHGGVAAYEGIDQLTEQATGAIEAALEAEVLDHGRVCSAYRRATRFARQPSVATHALPKPSSAPPQLVARIGHDA